MIRRRPEDHACVLKTAEAGLAAVERASKLTRQLLTFARRQNPEPETVNRTRSSRLESAGPAASGKAISLRVDTGPAVHPTNIDASEFEAANVDDAKRIGPKDHETSADPLTVGEYVIVDVADNGVGWTKPRSLGFRAVLHDEGVRPRLRAGLEPGLRLRPRCRRKGQDFVEGR